MNLHEVLLASRMAGKNNGNSESVDLSDYYTKSQTDGLMSAKVDKVSGMSLSQNSFTDVEKTKLSELENYDDAEIKSKIALNYGTLGYQKKNLLKNTTASKTQNGVTFTVNEDGSVTANGTATANSGLLLSEPFTLPAGKYCLNGCTGGENGTYRINLQNISTASNYNGDTIVELSADTVTQGRVFIQKDFVADNLTFYPMLHYAEITDDIYEPYRPSVAEYMANHIVTLDSVGDFENLTNKTAEFYFIREEQS